MNCQCPNCSIRKMIFKANDDTELHRLVICKEVKLNSIRMLLNREDPNARDAHYDTPLHLAAITDNYEVVEELIKAGANVQVWNLAQNTPLHIAVLHCNRKVIEVLLQSGADVNSENVLRNTPLHLAVKSSLYMKKKRHDKLIVQKLIQAGADVNCINKFNETPLFRAVETGDFEIVQILLTSGADTNIYDNNSISCLHIALFKLHPNQTLIEELIKYDANIYCKDKWFRTPLDLAVLRYFDDPSDELKTAKALIKMSVLVHPKEPIDICRIVEKMVVHNLYEFHKVCSITVRRMMAFWITEDISLHDFALRGLKCKIFSCNKLPEKIYSKVLVALLKGKCGVYSDIVECYIPELYLKEVIMNFSIRVKNETNKGDIELLSDVVRLICDYLNRTDLLRLIQASLMTQSYQAE
ncbi:serine/threonine-protein phosphatase 6 regulatory ankyrin repeat subunit B-like [Argiope bruennichi]|uniref:serine/threonine-protein phosphatase 6 regulatory ankyrin repeat subunit B-like n=1 Tax=Argiope bruennichi TaxID=94029 RepID=UPI0024952808|nr:serine/threonine-protein phosphatase 6 regulatory ankyrin repeat subunit B-like [Argiope bruennichi]